MGSPTISLKNKKLRYLRNHGSKFECHKINVVLQFESRCSVSNLTADTPSTKVSMWYCQIELTWLIRKHQPAQWCNTCHIRVLFWRVPFWKKNNSRLLGSIETVITTPCLQTVDKGYQEKSKFWSSKPITFQITWGSLTFGDHALLNWQGENY